MKLMRKLLPDSVGPAIHPFSWVLTDVSVGPICQLGLGFGVFFQLIAPRSDCAALQHLHTAGSGVKPELTSQRGLVSPAIPTLFCSELHAGQHCLRNEKNIWSLNCSCGLHGAELRQLFTAKCTRTMLLLVLLLEFSITIPKCVKTKIIQVFTLLY